MSTDATNGRQVRPSDPFLMFFQDALMGASPEPDGEVTTRPELDALLDRKAAELGVKPREIRSVRRIAEYVVSTPIAIVEIRYEPDEDALEPARAVAFATPAYGDFMTVAKSMLEREGYVAEFESDPDEGDSPYFQVVHPVTAVVVVVSAYEMVPLAQGPSGFERMVDIYARALRSSDGDEEMED